MRAKQAELKRSFLKLLEEDVEFRYAVAGYLGLSEILKRLDRIEEEQLRLREDFNRMQKTIEGMQKTIADMQKTIAEMLKGMRSIDKRLTRVERTLEKLTLDIEEEARSIVSHRLRQMGLEVELKSLQLPELEINIYGATEDVCVIGECRVRASLNTLRELKNKLEDIKRLRPDLLRERVILVIYTSLAMPKLEEGAREEGVWVLKATGDIVELPTLV